MCRSLFTARDELLQITHKTTYMETFEKAIYQLSQDHISPVIQVEEDEIVTQMIHEKCIQIEHEKVEEPQ